MTILLVIVSSLTIMAALLLTTYLELRIDALVRTGDLPRDTPRIWGWDGLNLGISLETLYSRRLRETDRHTRALVPIIRVALPLGFVTFFALAFVEMVGWP